MSLSLSSPPVAYSNSRRSQFFMSEEVNIVGKSTTIRIDSQLSRENYGVEEMSPTATPKQRRVEATHKGLGFLVLDQIDANAAGQGRHIDVNFWGRKCAENLVRAGQDEGVSSKPVDVLPETLGVARRLFLEGFRYDHMDDRQVQIAEAHEKTFRWIWEPASTPMLGWDDFPRWLASSSPLYWITGKVSAMSIAPLVKLDEPEDL